MIFAAADNFSTLIPDLGNSGAVTANQWKHFGIIIAVSLGVALIVVLVVKLSRSRKAQTVGRSGSGRRRRGGEKKRERFTHRNPTRAEMGGLPPLREELPGDQPPPP